MSKQKDNQKVSKREQRRLDVQREKRMRMIRIWGPIGVAVIGLIIFAALRLGNVKEIEGVTIVSSAQSNQHDSELHIEFGGLPPMGGPHNPIWENCGIYDTPVLPEHAIHSMEHGAVWISYHPDISDADLLTLQDLARGDNYLLLAPYPDLAANIVLTVWDRQLAIESPGDDRIEQFIDGYRRTRGPESAAQCNGGIGQPIG